MFRYYVAQLDSECGYGLSAVKAFQKVGKGGLTLKCNVNLVLSLFGTSTQISNDPFVMWSAATWIARLSTNYTVTVPEYPHIE